MSRETESQTEQKQSSSPTSNETDAPVENETPKSSSSEPTPENSKTNKDSPPPEESPNPLATRETEAWLSLTRRLIDLPLGEYIQIGGDALDGLRLCNAPRWLGNRNRAQFGSDIRDLLLSYEDDGVTLTPEAVSIANAIQRAYNGGISLHDSIRPMIAFAAITLWGNRDGISYIS